MSAKFYENQSRFLYSSHLYIAPTYSFVKIGPDLDIAPIYSFVRFHVNGAPKSLYIFRFARNLVQPTELGLE